MFLRLITLICFFSSCFINESSGQSPVAEKGILDISNYNPNDDFIIKLNGNWEFYWKKILRPHDFQTGNPKPDYFGKVPSYWTDYPQDEVETSKLGFATYRLTVLLPPDMNKPLAIDLPVFDSSYDIYINGKYIGGNGTVEKTKAGTIPEYRRNFFKIDTQSDSLTVIINVSNFHHRRGGFWLPVTLGTFNLVQRKVANSWGADWSVITLLLGFSMFFLFFFFIRPQEKIMAFFSMATIGLALRPLFTSNFLILEFFELKWEWIVKFEYLDLYMILIGWIWVVLTFYPTRIFKMFAWAITTIFGFAFLLTIFLPVDIFSYATLLFYPAMVSLMGYALIKSFLGVLNKTPLDIVYFTAFLLLIIVGFHDIRVSLGKADSTSGYLLTYSVVVFIFIQAVLLLYKWVRTISEKEKLHDEIEYMKRNLEILVNERTQELITRNEKIEKQNKQIALQNKQLSDTIQLKNKIFSVISHDLRGPVVNILYMLNLLKEKEFKEKYDTFANSSIQYAQQVISLLENMLVWGRGQEDKLKYSPEKLNLADIILTNLSIFKETADKKDISLNFTQVGNTIAYVDKDLLDIIIRNLLSNAVKYTSRGGRISILLKDKSMDEEGILLKICDNGIGIPALKQKYLFSSTEIASTPGTEDEKGTGLGLKLCHELVIINKGKISVESKEGEGTCFAISLPKDKTN
jgi:signal transduction histidine kinase